MMKGSSRRYANTIACEGKEYMILSMDRAACCHLFALRFSHFWRILLHILRKRKGRNAGSIGAVNIQLNQFGIPSHSWIGMKRKFLDDQRCWLQAFQALHIIIFHCCQRYNNGKRGFLAGQVKCFLSLRLGGTLPQVGNGRTYFHQQGESSLAAPGG